MKTTLLAEYRFQDEQEACNKADQLLVGTILDIRSELWVVKGSNFDGNYIIRNVVSGRTYEVRPTGWYTSYEIRLGVVKCMNELSA